MEKYQLWGNECTVSKSEHFTIQKLYKNFLFESIFNSWFSIFLLLQFLSHLFELWFATSYFILHILHSVKKKYFAWIYVVLAYKGKMHDWYLIELSLKKCQKWRKNMKIICKKIWKQVRAPLIYSLYYIALFVNYYEKKS